MRQQFHQSVLRYDVAYKQSTKSFLTEAIGQKDTARDKVTKVIEWVARYWMELPDEEDAVRDPFPALGGSFAPCGTMFGVLGGTLNAVDTRTRAASDST